MSAVLDTLSALRRANGEASTNNQYYAPLMMLDAQGVYTSPGGGLGGGSLGTGDYDYGGIFIHEQGHAFGMPHAGEAYDQGKFPYPGGSLLGSVWGFDAARGQFLAPFIPPTADSASGCLDDPSRQKDGEGRCVKQDPMQSSAVRGRGQLVRLGHAAADGGDGAGRPRAPRAAAGRADARAVRRAAAGAGRAAPDRAAAHARRRHGRVPGRRGGLGHRGLGLGLRGRPVRRRARAAGCSPCFGVSAVIRELDERVRARVVAASSAMWILPAFVGPPGTLALEHAVGWRWALLAPVPIVLAGRFLVAGAATHRAGRAGAAAGRAHAADPGRGGGAAGHPLAGAGRGRGGGRARRRGQADAGRHRAGCGPGRRPRSRR